jgi:hypothetical protein
MSSGAMAPCPVDSDLMKAWTAYQETEDFKNSVYWATTETRMRQERAEELNVPANANRATPYMREERAKGSLWAAFMAGFSAAGGKVSF